MKNQQNKCKHCQNDITPMMKKCPQCGGDLRDWARRHPVLTILFVLFLIGFLPSLFGNNDKPSNTNINNNSLETLENSGNKSTKQYIEVFRFSGNGAKKSEPFTITGSRLKISYDCNGDICQAFIYKVDSQLPQLVMNSGSIKDETIIYGKGDYYIDANVMGNFSMIIYDYK